MKNKYLRIWTILCLMFMVAFICVHVHAEETETTTITVNVSLPPDCDYTDDGITMEVRIGNILHSGGGGGGYYERGDGRIGYDGIYEYSPVVVGGSSVSKIQSKNITFNEGETETTVEFIVTKSTAIRDLYAYYNINDDRYMGSGYRRMLDNNVELAVDCIKKITLSGTIALTDIDDDVQYVIYAEENRRIENNEINYDSYVRAYRYVPAETGNDVYSLEIKPDTAYTLTVIFENHDFVYQQKEFTTVDEDMTVDFSDFVRSPEITGIIKLPDCITDATDVFGYVHLQSAKAPHYQTSAYANAYFDFSEGRECSFSILNDLGADKVIVYYTVSSDTAGLYYGGNYLNDTACTKNVADAAVIDGSGGTIVLNMLESDPYPLEVGEPYITEDNKYAVDIFNSGLFRNDLMVYTADYDSSGSLVNITQEPLAIWAQETESFEFEKTDGKQSIFIWDGMQPIALKTKIN